MKIQLGKIVNSKDALGRLLGEKFPVKTSYMIQKNFRTVESELKSYEEQRSKLIVEKYGVREITATGEQTESWKVPDDRMVSFSKEMNELFSVELELSLSKVKLPESCEISPSDIYLLDWMIDFEDDKIEESKKEEN